MTNAVSPGRDGKIILSLRSVSAVIAISRSSSKKINDKRDKEAYEIFKKYRKPHLSLLNPIDLSVYYECWLYYRYKGFFGHKGIAVLNKFSLFYWYSRCFV